MVRYVAAEERGVPVSLEEARRRAVAYYARYGIVVKPTSIVLDHSREELPVPFYRVMLAFHSLDEALELRREQRERLAQTGGQPGRAGVGETPKR